MRFFSGKQLSLERQKSTAGQVHQDVLRNSFSSPMFCFHRIH